MWTLGYRGNNDCSFWLTEPGKFSDARKGRVISEAMRVQYRLLQEELGPREVPCVYYLYRENQVLYQRGHIQVPPGVAVVWCDNGYGTMETYFRAGHELAPPGTPIPLAGEPRPAWPARRQARGGLYYHVSFYDGAAPNRVQYVAPAKIYRAFTRAGRLGLTDFLLVNVGNIREFVLSVRAAFDLARAPAGWQPGLFVGDWCRSYVGPQHASPVAAAYRRLYDAHWWWRTDPGKCFGDNIVRTLLDDVIGCLQSTRHPRWWQPRCYLRTDDLRQLLAIIRTDGAASRARWQVAERAAERAEAALTGVGRRFFHENVTVQARRGLGAVATLVLAAAAVDVLLALRRLHGGEEPLHRERLTNQYRRRCLQLVQEAQRAARRWDDALGATDRPPKWTGWSRSDHFLLPAVVHDQLRGLEHLVRAHLTVDTFVSDIGNFLARADGRGASGDDHPAR